MAVPQRGEIWSVYTPGQPDDPHQPRPALIISEDIRNRRADDVIVVPIFSGGRPGPTRVPIPAGTSGLHHNSVIFADEITTINRDFLRGGPLGPRVPTDILDQTLAAILIAIGGQPW